MVKQGIRILEALQVDETISPFIASQQGCYVGITALILATGLLLVTIVTTLMSWHADYHAAQHSLTPVLTTTLATTTTQIDSIPSLHIFGNAALEDSDFLPVTSAQLHLTGIINNSNHQASHIIISEAGSSGKIYALGDEVVAGFKINAINADNVVLEHNGRFEKLPLVRAQLVFKEKPQSLWQNG